MGPPRRSEGGGKPRPYVQKRTSDADATDQGAANLRPMRTPDPGVGAGLAPARSPALGQSLREAAERLTRL